MNKLNNEKELTCSVCYGTGFYTTEDKEIYTRTINYDHMGEYPGVYYRSEVIEVQDVVYFTKEVKCYKCNKT